MKTHDADYMRAFLDQCHCFRTRQQALNFIDRDIPVETQDFSDKCVDVEAYEKGFVVHQNYFLSEKEVAGVPEQYVKLSTVRTGYIGSIIENLNKGWFIYFSEVKSDNSRVFALLTSKSTLFMTSLQLSALISLLKRSICILQ